MQSARLATVLRPWRPQSAFGADLVQLFDARSGVFSDSGSTEIAAGGTVQQWNDLSGNAKNLSQTTALNKPTWNTGSGLSWVASDGSDDFMNSAAIDLSGVAQITIFAGVRKLSDAAAQFIAEVGSNTTTNARGLAIGAGTLSGDASRRTWFISHETGNATPQTVGGAAVFTQPTSAVLTAMFDRSQATTATELTMRVNAVLQSLTYNNTNVSSGNYSNSALYVGRTAAGGSPFTGRLYCLAIVKRACTAAEIARMEAWVNARTGAY